MSAERLREAARQIRVDQQFEVALGHIDDREYATWLASADWLDASADVVEAEERDQCGPGIGTRNALAVANAYLGSPS